MKPRTIALLLMITFAEATIGIFVKLTGDHIPVQSLNFYALTASAAFLAIALPRVTHHRLAFPRDNLRDTFLIGVLIAAQIGVFNYAMTQAPVANVVIFWSIAPFFVFIFSAVFLHEPARWTYVFIFAVAIVGIFIAQPLAGGNMLGNLVALGDGAIYAAMVVYLRFEGKTETGNDIFWSMATAALVLAPALVIFGPGDLAATVHYETIGASLPIALWVLGLGVFSTGCAYLGISLVLSAINANVYSLVDIIVSPVIATLLGFIVLGEVPAQSMVFGGALLLGAGFWLTWEMSKTDSRRAAHPSQASWPALTEQTD
ncbi:MAG: DMT family transporter [Dehalococcoidia bacterium]|nr:DMT family transporter [Dehalococcoidia bacterium]